MLTPAAGARSAPRSDAELSEGAHALWDPSEALPEEGGRAGSPPLGLTSLPVRELLNARRRGGPEVASEPPSRQCFAMGRRVLVCLVLLAVALSVVHAGRRRPGPLARTPDMGRKAAPPADGPGGGPMRSNVADAPEIEKTAKECKNGTQFIKNRCRYVFSINK